MHTQAIQTHVQTQPCTLKPYRHTYKRSHAHSCMHREKLLNWWAKTLTILTMYQSCGRHQHILCKDRAPTGGACVCVCSCVCVSLSLYMCVPDPGHLYVCLSYFALALPDISVLLCWHSFVSKDRKMEKQSKAAVGCSCWNGIFLSSEGTRNPYKDSCDLLYEQSISHKRNLQMHSVNP